MKKHRSQSKQKIQNPKYSGLPQVINNKLIKLNLNTILQMKNSITICPHSNFETNRNIQKIQKKMSQHEQNNKNSLLPNHKFRQTQPSIQFNSPQIRDRKQTIQEEPLMLKTVRYHQNLQQQLRELKIETSKISKRQYGKIKAYAVNTHPGFLNNVNEDRITIITNLSNVDIKLKSDQLVSYFAIYSGHNGVGCCQFLRDYLHIYISKDPQFHKNIQNAIYNAISKIQSQFFKQSEKKNDYSGSSALILIFKGQKCYLANIGDSRAIMSINLGQKIIQLSNDHNPNSQQQVKRIKKAGGSISIPKIFNTLGQTKRVQPSNLQVTRSIGDYEVKMNIKIQLQMIQKQINLVLRQIQISFLWQVCDGVFNSLSNQQIVKQIWCNALRKQKEDIHEECGEIINKLMVRCVKKGRFENISCLYICFDWMQKALFELDEIRLPNICYK